MRETSFLKHKFITEIMTFVNQATLHGTIADARVVIDNINKCNKYNFSKYKRASEYTDIARSN